MGLLEHTEEMARKKSSSRDGDDAGARQEGPESALQSRSRRDGGDSQHHRGPGARRRPTLQGLGIQLDFYPKTNLRDKAAERVRLPSHPSLVDADENCLDFVRHREE